MDTKRAKMKCLHCGQANMKVTRGSHAYALGKDWAVTLDDVEILRCPNCQEWEVAIPQIDKLHRTIALAVARKPRRLAAPEIVFLRKQMDMEAKSLAEVLGVTPQTMSRWENGKVPIDVTAERLLRLLTVVRDHDEETFDTDELATFVQEGAPMRLTVKMTKGEWRAAA